MIAYGKISSVTSILLVRIAEAYVDMSHTSDGDNSSAPPLIKDLLRSHSLPLTLVLLSTLFATLGDRATQWLRYDRIAILSGQWWRIISGNVVHLGWPHLLLNLAGLILVWLLFRRALTTSAWIIVTLASSMAVGVGLLIFDPALHWYVGLSGVLHGLFAAGVISSLYTGNRGDWWLLLLFMAKITWEQMVGSMPGSVDIAGGSVIVDAHLYGAIGGAVTTLLILLERKRN
jgi:rhomboid family GlyGly-CTERM serine protease